MPSSPPFDVAVVVDVGVDLGDVVGLNSVEGLKLVDGDILGELTTLSFFDVSILAYGEL